MASGELTPVAADRRLRAELRRARERVGLTQKAVAEALDWSTSKVIRLESGAVGISITDLKALLLHYGITDPGEVDGMVELARLTKQSAWWNEYRDLDKTGDFLKFLGLEASSVRIRQFQGLVVPGLLQSPAYAKALFATGETEDRVRQRAIEVRLKRQQLVLDGHVEFIAILDESVLYRNPRSEAVLLDQLRHLRRMSELVNVTIQVIPFSVVLHKGMKGSFAVFELSEELNDYALLLEHPYRDVLVPDTSDEIREFVGIFFELERIALPEAETRALVDARIKELEGQLEG